jgi:hypothetical protein
MSCFGSGTDITAGPINVRYAPESRHPDYITRHLLKAIKRHSDHPPCKCCIRCSAWNILVRTDPIFGRGDFCESGGRTMAPFISNTAAVLGVDIGWAPNDSTTGVCRLDWTSNAASFVCSCAPLGRRRDLLYDFADRELLVSAFDGPLRGDLAIIGHYRLAEQLLTERLGQHIGKLGQSSSPIGKLLNFHASVCQPALWHLISYPKGQTPNGNLCTRS